MACPNDKYRNPDAPPGYMNPLEQDTLPLPEIEHDPCAPPGLYKFEADPDSNKINIPMLEFVFELEILLNEKPEDNLSDFVVQTSDEEDSDSAEEIVSKKSTKSEDSKDSTDDAASSRSSSVVEQKVQIKSELQIDEPDHLFGSYHCAVCNIKMNSESTYVAHVNGKRHLKALKQRNVADTVAKSIPTREDGSKCPIPASGVRRVQMKEAAIVQDLIANKLSSPCPGLYKVIEIQGITETSYYCTLCDSPCGANAIIPHLGGYRHQLKCLKYFRPDLYDKFSYEPKYKIEGQVISALKAIERKEGLGKVIVEKEFYEDDDSHSRSGSRRDRDIYKPSTSSVHSSAPKCDFGTDDILDKSKSGFYCRVCESFMNSEVMWENHIRGKRHAANLKKSPGSLPSKLKFIPVQNARAFIMERLQDIDEPVVGLDHIRETQNHETKSETYQCLLCSACLTHLDIIEHLLSQKHRKKYLQQINHPDLHILDSMNFHNQNVNALIEEICDQAEREYGRGQPTVCISKDTYKY